MNRIGGTITRIFNRLRRRCRRTQMMSNLEELDQLGYTIVRNQLSRATCKTIVDEFSRWIDRNWDVTAKYRDEDGHFPRIINAHEAVSLLANAWESCDAALVFVDGFFHERTSLYTTLYYERGSAQALHRDTPLFWTNPPYKYCGMWIAFEDADADNGPLVVVPGSHNLPEMDRNGIANRFYGKRAQDIPDYSHDLWLAYQADVNRMAREFGLTETEIHVQAGDVIIWHPQLVHVGAQIRDSVRTRHSLVCHVTPENVPVFHHDYFFNLDRRMPERPPWQYRYVGDRTVAANGHVSFGHDEQIPAKKLR